MFLLSINSKLNKGNPFGYLSSGIHLAPAKLSGYEVCQGRSAGCTASCLNISGMGGFPKVQKSRVEKTRRFFEERQSFLLDLVYEIRCKLLEAEKEKLIPCFRLNLTSDILWENVLLENGKTIFEIFPTVQFYDYTKIYKRLKDCAFILNYHLTFSRSESAINHLQSNLALKEGFNVAIVFSTSKKEKLPESYNGYKVIDGDINDLRFLDPVNCIVGLRAKCRARNDKSGFVIKTSTAKEPKEPRQKSLRQKKIATRCLLH